MISKEIENVFRPIVEKFVESKDKFYQKHISDKMLVELILFQLWNPSRDDNKKSIAESILEGGRTSEAYNAVCWLFEYILEHKCDAGGNGHHMAQSFSDAVETALTNRKPGLP